MTQVTGNVSQAREPVSKIYELGVRLCDSPSFSLYIGRVPLQRETRLILVGKTSFVPTEIRAQYFQGRVEVLKNYFGRTFVPGSVLRGELDSEGYPFLELVRVEGEPYATVRRSAAEAERRFLALVRSVSKFHHQGLWFGDITPSSIFMGASMEPIVVGLIGLTGPIVLASTAVDHAVHLAPEVRQGRPSSAASDVFSVCVMGAQIFGVTFQSREVIRAAEVREKLVREGAPGWFCDVALHGLASRVDERPADCIQLLALMQSARDGMLSGPLMIRDSGAVAAVSTGDGTNDRSLIVAPRISQGTHKEYYNFGRIVAASVLLAVLVVIAVFYREGVTTIEDEEHWGRSTELLKRAGFSAAMSPDERKQLFGKLADSEDPIAHDALLSLVSRAQSVDDRVEAEKSLLNRCERMGMRRSVKVVRLWFGDQPVKRPQGFVAALRALDRSIPAGEHDAALKEVAQRDRTVAIQLAAALLLDWGARDSDRKTLSQLVTGVPDDKDIMQRPLSAILLSLPETQRSFPQDTQEGLRSVGVGDLMWLLATIVEREDDTLRAVVVSALGNSEGLREIPRRIIELALSGSNIPRDVRSAAVRLSSGTLDKGDIATVGQWDDIRAAEILLLISQLEISNEVLENILHYLVIKKIDTEPVKGIVSWLGKTTPENRMAWGRIPGYFLLMSYQERTPESVNEALIRMTAETPELLRAVMDSNCNPCKEVVVNSAPEKLSSSMLFDLLRCDGPALRIKALRRLGLYDDVGAVNLLRQSYQLEENEDVRRVYRESFPKIFTEG